MSVDSSQAKQAHDSKGNKDEDQFKIRERQIHNRHTLLQPYTERGEILATVNRT